MKYKSLLLVMSLSVISLNVFAERDVLLETNSATAVIGTEDYLIESVRPQTAETITQFAEQWMHYRESIAKALKHKEEGILTELDKVMLKTITVGEKEYIRHSYSKLFDKHIIGRVHFYERSHNWNGENEYDNEYRYFTYPGAHYQGRDSYTNSYGFNVLRVMADKMRAAMYDLESSELEGTDFKIEVESRLKSIIGETQATVQNDELRYYINQTLWYATKQTMKERGKVEPNPKDYQERKIDLRTLINE